MMMTSSEELLIVLSVLAGALHVLAPDHWIPLSLLSWQRGWSAFKTNAISIPAFFAHVTTGFAVFLALRPLLVFVDARKFFVFSVGLVLVGAALRAARFSAIRDVLRLGSNRIWGTWMIFSLLGPCESIIPIVLKAKLIGMGYALPLLAFTAGTLVAGMLLIFGGRRAWNEPMRLSQSMSRADRRRTAVPIVAGVALGLLVILKL